MWPFSRDEDPTLGQGCDAQQKGLHLEHCTGGQGEGQDRAGADPAQGSRRVLALHGTSTREQEFHPSHPPKGKDFRTLFKTVYCIFSSDKHIDFWTTVEDGNLSQTYLFENTNIKLYFPHL